MSSKIEVSRDLAERLNNLLRWSFGNETECVELRALLAKPKCSEVVPQCSEQLRTQAVQHLGEPVAICRLWNEGGSGERTSVEWIKRPCADGTFLYTGQPAPVSVVLPERSNERDHAGDWTYEAKAWNACLDEVTRLNTK